MIYAGYLFLGVAIGFFLFALFSVNDLQQKSAQQRVRNEGAGSSPQGASKRYRPRFYHAAPKGKLQNVT